MASKAAPKEEPVKASAVIPNVPAEPANYQPGVISWDALKESADQVLGHDLAKDEMADALVGVPFCITRVTFRPGFKKNSKAFGEGITFAYVSCEAVLAPLTELNRRRVNLQSLPFDAESLVVFNDGSTGVYRQIVQYLAAKEFIALPEGATEGPMGEVIFDLPPEKWTDVRTGNAVFDTDGFMQYDTNIRLLCPRGLRVSEYENEWTKDGKTRYLG